MVVDTHHCSALTDRDTGSDGGIGSSTLYLYTVLRSDSRCRPEPKVKDLRGDVPFCANLPDSTPPRPCPTRHNVLQHKPLRVMPVLRHERNSGLHSAAQLTTRRLDKVKPNGEQARITRLRRASGRGAK